MNIMRALLLNLLSLSGVLYAANTPLQSTPMSFEDIVAFQKPRWVVLSPSGNKAAFCVREGALKENRNFDTLYVYDSKEKTQTKIYQSDEIKRVNWGNDDASLFTLVNSKNNYKIISLSDKGEA